MRTAVMALTLFLVAVASAQAQQEKELLQPVNATQSQRLEEYNSVFLKEQVYFASRYRIVKVNTALLFQGSDLTVTPFDDVEPIKLSAAKGTPQRAYQDDHVFWRGQYPLPAGFGPELAAPNGPPPEFVTNYVTINMHSWDLNPSGDAEISSQNSFEFSPRWTFDEAGNPVLDKGNPSDSKVTAGPPPQTPEQIERRKRLLRLRKHAFYSVDAVFEVPGSNKYVLLPLKYTPKYSVMYEITRDTVTPFRIDVEPGDPELSADEKATAARHKAFRDGLLKETNKPIRGDVP